MINKIWFKGNIVHKKDATVPILSPTAQFGLNVFEGVKGYWNGKDKELIICELDAHLSRLRDSCKLVGIQCQYSNNQIKTFISDYVASESIKKDVYFRIVLFVDSNEACSNNSWFSSDPVHLMIAATIKERKNPKTITGASACTSSWTRIDDLSMPPRVKAGANYFAGRYSHFEAKAGHYDLPILINKYGKVAEGAGSCIFIIKADNLITPSSSSSILESITRKIVLKLSGSIGLKSEVRDLDRTEIYTADEVFLCGTTAELIPIISLDGIKISNGLVGQQTKNILKSYLEYACLLYTSPSPRDS